MGMMFMVNKRSHRHMLRTGCDA